MAIDINRYPLITAEYRYASVLLPAIGAAYSKARDLEIDSKFRYVANVSGLAVAIANVIGSPKRRLEIVVSGTDLLSIDNFTSRVPIAFVVAPALNVNAYFAITRAKIDEDEGTTVMEAWGG